MALLRAVWRPAASGSLFGQLDHCSGKKGLSTIANDTEKMARMVAKEPHKLSTTELAEALYSISAAKVAEREVWRAAEHQLLKSRDLYTLSASALARLAQAFSRHEQGSRDLFDQIQREACSRWNKLGNRDVVILAQAFARLRYDAKDFFDAVVNVDATRLRR